MHEKYNIFIIYPYSQMNAYAQPWLTQVYIVSAKCMKKASICVHVNSDAYTRICVNRTVDVYM